MFCIYQGTDDSDSMIKNMTMKIGANDIFRVKSRKNLVFLVKPGQDKPKLKLDDKPETPEQIWNSQTQ